jgi:hypothetical protein
VFFHVLHHPMDAETHNTLLGKQKRKASQWGSGGWEAEACTPPGVLLRYLWGLNSMSRHICMIFVADLTACRLDFFTSVAAVACRPATPRLWSGFLVWLL